MRVEGEDGVVCNSFQELVQGLHPSLHKLLGKTIDHALHHKLLWQRLEMGGRRQSRDKTEVQKRA